MDFTTVNGSGIKGANRAIAASIPGIYLSKSNWAAAGEALMSLAACTTGGALPVSAEDSRPDAEASLWFIRAAQLFAKGAGDDAATGKLRESIKRILQEFISEQGVGGVTMDHGGMLTVAADQSAGEALRLNALWYSALEATAVDLKAAGDKSGDHFERLAGRFRRTFAKTFWCEGHGCICPPHARQETTHGELPDPDQLLLTILPASPMPRTKQRQLVQVVRDRGMKGSSKGIWVDHPKHGRVESAVHRAWLAVGILNSADNRNAAVLEARGVLQPFEALVASGAGVAEFYKDGQPVGEADLVTTAEVMGAMGMVGN